MEEQRKQTVPQTLRDNLAQLEKQRDELKATFQLIQLRAQNAKADLDAVEEKIRQTRKLISELEGGAELTLTTEYSHMKLIDAAVRYMERVDGVANVPNEMVTELGKRGAKLGYGTRGEKLLSETDNPFRQLTQTFARHPDRVIYDPKTETARLPTTKIVT